MSASAPLRVTCILPVYNGERYLREAIDSVFAQTVPPFEVIVVDDGSTDATAEIVRSYGDRLRFVRQANAGPAAARNHGLRLARGELIAFQDADDVWCADKIERQVARFAARPGLQLCSAHLQNFWVAELKEEAERFRGRQQSRPFPGVGSPPALLVRRTLLDAVGEFDASLRSGEDTDWFLRVVERKVLMEVLPEVLVHRRFHAGNISRGPRSTVAEIVKASLDRRRRDRGDVAAPLASPLAAPVDSAVPPR